MKILVVEDEKDLRESLVEGLRLDGYAVDACGDGLSADELLFVEPYDLVILDLNLPGMDGIEVLRNLREHNRQLNVLVLSARTSLEDKVSGLDLGANDYMTKPFHFAELQARVRSMLRRKTVIENAVLSCGVVAFDTVSRVTTVQGEVLHLTGKESAILEYLLLHKERVLKIEEIMAHVWDGEADSLSNSARVHLSSLRRKFRDVLGYDPIQSIIGEGYVMREART